MNKLELKSAVRSLVKKKLFSFVNIGGLTFGLLSALFIGIYVLHQFSFDQSYPDADRIYRVVLDREKGGLNEKLVLGPTGLQPALQESIPQIENAVRIQRSGSMVFSVDNEFVKERKSYYVDKDYFNLFGIDLLEGDPEHALDAPNAILLSESLKQKYFDDEMVLGKTIKMSLSYRSNFEEYVVTGVYPDAPDNVHFRPNFLFSIEKIRLLQSRPIDQEWSNFNALTYVKLNEDVQPSEVAKAMEQVAAVRNADFAESGHSFGLQSVADIHMQDFVAFGDFPGNVKRSSMYILMGIGLLILLLVCINFFNLSMARSLERAKEVGVRKSIGATRFQLMRLYLLEAGMQVTISLLLAVILFEVTGNFFSNFLGIPVSMAEMTSGLGMGTFIGLAALLCLLLVSGAGFYPAMVLSRFKLVESLKGKVKLKSSRFSLGQSLLVIQFMITLVIGIVASIIYTQVNFMHKADPGYERQGTVAFQVFSAKQLTQFGDRLDSNPLVESVTYGDDEIWNLFNSASNYNWEGKADDERFRVYRLSIDNNFIAAMNIELLQGRSFDERLASDSNSVILNESAAKLMNIQSLSDFPTIKKGAETLNVVGIVKDFQAGDFRQAEKPIVMYRNPGRFYTAYVKLNSQDKAAALKSLETTWKEVLPQKPFEYRFLDDAYELLLVQDRVTSQVLLFFTGLSILISFIGLFGMIRLRVQNRMKEMGIRKILGANFAQILKVVSSEFALYLFLAVLAGIPIAIFAGKSWLDEFAQRITIGFSLPVMVVLGMVAIALSTLLLSAFPLNRLNLVETLKDE